MTDFGRYIEDRAAFRRNEIVLPSGDLYGHVEEEWQREHIWQPWDSGAYNLLYLEAARGLTKTFAAAVMALESMLFEQYVEAHAFASDAEQAALLQRALSGMIERNPILQSSFRLSRMLVECPSTGSSLRIQTSDAPSSYGLGGTGRSLLVIADEVWTWAGANAESLWASIISATGKVQGRWRIVCLSNAGIEGVSEVAWRVREEARQNPEHYFWRSGPATIASWISEGWVETQRRLLLPNAFTRLIENEWVGPDSTAITPAEFDACVVPDLNPYPERANAVIVGLDASKSAKAGADTTAAVAVSREGESYRLVAHRIWRPDGSGGDVDYRDTILPWLVDLRRRYGHVRVLYDPYNLSMLAQVAREAGVSMVEYPQTSERLSIAAEVFLSAFRSRSVRLYPADDLREHVTNAVLIEGVRGVRLAKEKSSRKVDGAVALAMALTEARSFAGEPLARSLHFARPSEMEELLGKLAAPQGQPEPEPEEPSVWLMLGEGFDWHMTEDAWGRTYRWGTGDRVKVPPTLAAQLLELGGKFLETSEPEPEVPEPRDHLVEYLGLRSWVALDSWGRTYLWSEHGTRCWIPGSLSSKLTADDDRFAVIEIAEKEPERILEMAT